MSFGVKVAQRPEFRSILRNESLRVLRVQRLFGWSLLLMMTSGCVAPVSIEAGFEPGQRQKSARADSLTWGACPPSIPGACQMAILEGNPAAPQLFTIRLRTSGPLNLPAHTHPGAERVTVLAGHISVGFGDSNSSFGAGDYYVNAPDTVHTVRAEEPVTVQLTGIGPWQVNYVQEQEENSD